MQFMKKISKLTKKRIINYICFGLGTLVTLTISVVSFVKLNSLISEFRDLEAQENEMGNLVTPLETENKNLLEGLNNQNATWYCSNPHDNPNCALFYSNMECEVDAETHICPSCSTRTEFVFVESKEAHASDIQKQIDDNKQKIDDLKPVFEGIKNDKKNKQDEMPTFQFFGILFTPISIVLLLLTIFSSKEN